MAVVRIVNNIKKLVTNKLNTGSLEKSKDKILRRIESYDSVSFDVFDTLLKRNISSPTQLFELMQLKLKDKIMDFKKKRIQAEVEARTKLKKEEISLDDIYNEFESEEINFDFVKKMELETEREILTCNNDMKFVYDYCIVKKKKIYILSDMYLPKKFVISVLEENGFLNYEKVYVSSESLKTKRNGNLYDLFLKDNGIKKTDNIHIGDSWYADYLVPRCKGISAIHIPREIKGEQIFDGNKINTNYLSSFINNFLSTNQDVYQKFGFGKFGPFLWGYVRWIERKLRESNIKKVYFFSRDGFIMKKAFDILFKNDNIESYYLEVSRRSLRVPTLWMDDSFENMLSMLSPAKLVTLKSIFECVGLNIESYESLIRKFDFTFDTKFYRSKIKNDSKLIRMYNHLRHEISSNSFLEYKELEKYICENKLNGKFAIVDIGWSGGMQRSLNQILNNLNIDHDIVGLYIGVADYFKRNVHESDLNMNGYLFDFKNNKNEVDKRSSFVGLFETMFLEQGGSVKNYSYSKEGNKEVAIRYPYEYIIDGKESFELREVKSIQEAALDFIKEVSNDKELTNLLTFTPDELYTGILRTGTHPRKKDIEMFAEFNFYDDGVSKHLAHPNKVIHYLYKPKDLKVDFLESRWKIGFLKKMFRLNLPYETLYHWLYKFK